MLGLADCALACVWHDCAFFSHPLHPVCFHTHSAFTLSDADRLTLALRHVQDFKVKFSVKAPLLSAEARTKLNTEHVHAACLSSDGVNFRRLAQCAGPQG